VVVAGGCWLLLLVVVAGGCWLLLLVVVAGGCWFGVVGVVVIVVISFIINYNDMFKYKSIFIFIFLYNNNNKLLKISNTYYCINNSLIYIFIKWEMQHHKR